MLRALPSIVLGLVILFILSMVGYNVLVDQRDTYTVDTTDYNQSQEFVDNYTSWTDNYGLIITVIGAVVILGIVGMLGVGKSRGAF